MQTKFKNILLGLLCLAIISFLVPNIVLAGDALELKLTASPDSGKAPLENVDFIVEVISGELPSNARYSLFCIKDKLVWIFAKEGINIHACDYNSSGIYYAEVRAINPSNGDIFATAEAKITVTEPKKPKEDNNEQNLGKCEDTCLSLSDPKKCQESCCAKQQKNLCDSCCNIYFAWRI